MDGSRRVPGVLGISRGLKHSLTHTYTNTHPEEKEQQPPVIRTGVHRRTQLMP